MRNLGFAFGLGEGVPNYFYLALLAVILILLVFRWLKGIGWWLIWIGGLANMITRLRQGYVWDYWHWSWLVDIWFNLADVLIVVGVVIAIVEQFKKEDHGKT